MLTTCLLIVYRIVRPLQRDLARMLPHLWSVLLELSALLNEPLSRLLAFILPVCQYCCGGIEFPLSRETKKREDKIVIAVCTRGDHICI